MTDPRPRLDPARNFLPFVRNLGIIVRHADFLRKRRGRLRRTDRHQARLFNETGRNVHAGNAEELAAGRAG